jgi:hypothetical protein
MTDAYVYFTALKQRWVTDVGEQFNGQFFRTVDQVPEGTVRPYAMVKTISEGRESSSVQGQYDALVWEVSIYADKDDQGNELMGLLDASTRRDPPMDLQDGYRLTNVRQGNAREEEVRNYWKVTREYHARIAKASVVSD